MPSDKSKKEVAIERIDFQPDFLGTYCLLAYFNCQPSDVERLFSIMQENAEWITAPSPRLRIRNPENPYWLIYLWPGGKAICCSTRSFEDAKSCAVWLRTVVFQKAGLIPRTEALGRISNGKAELQLRTVESIYQVCLAENWETVQALVGLKESSIDLQKVSHVLAELSLTDIIAEHKIDNHNWQLHGLQIDIQGKENLLARLHTFSAADIEERAQRAPDSTKKLRAKYVLKGIVDISWAIALGVLGNAIFEYVIVPLIRFFSETHAEDINMARKLDREKMQSAFPVLQFLSRTSPVTVSELSRLTDLPEWAVMIQINQLMMKKIVNGTEADGFLLISEPDLERLSFLESGFHPRSVTPMPVRRYGSVLDGLRNE